METNPQPPAMTDDEIRVQLNALQYEIGASTPGSEFAYAMAEEVLQLRQQVRELRKRLRLIVAM